MPNAKIANTQAVVLEFFSKYCPAKKAADAQIIEKRIENKYLKVLLAKNKKKNDKTAAIPINNPIAGSTCK